MKILSDEEYAYLKESLEESKALVEDVYSRGMTYNLIDISPMIAAVFLKITSSKSKDEKISDNDIIFAPLSLWVGRIKWKTRQL